MAIITDPSVLAQTTDIVFDYANRTIRVIDTGVITSDGISIQCLYSFTKEEWKTDSTLIKYPFPIEAITPEQFEFKNGWIPKDQSTINLLRNGGFAIKNTDGSSAAEYMGVITLGYIASTDQVYYQQAVGGAATNVVRTGAVNQCIPIISNKTTANRSSDLTYLSGNFNYSGVFNIFVRTYQKIYAQAQKSDIGVSVFTYQVYRFPLANSSDLKIENDDNTVSTTEPYTGITISYYDVSQERTIGGTGYNFDIIIDGNDGTIEEIYEKVQYSLRQNSDINLNSTSSGTVIGKTASALLRFVGDTLYTANGVYIDNFLLSDINNIVFYDEGGTPVSYPFVAGGNIYFNENLVNDGEAIYKMYYTSGFGTGSAVLVVDNDDVEIFGIVPSTGVATFTYDYANDTGGGGANVDKNITVVAIGLSKAQYVTATGTIQRIASNSITLSATLERNYSN